MASPMVFKYLIALALFPTLFALQALQAQQESHGSSLMRRQAEGAASEIDKIFEAKFMKHLKAFEGARTVSHQAANDESLGNLPAHFAKADDLIKELTSLADAGKCAVPLTTSWEADDVSADKKLFVVHLGKHEAPKKMVLNANTHAREAITAEVARSFIHWACGGSTDALNLLGEKSDFRITVVPIHNLSGRRVIDKGTNDCQRATADEGEGEVDLNRNMDVDFEKSVGHGPKPFSTYQARILKKVVEAAKPVAYLDLHSGFRSLMVSWGCRPHTTPDFPDQNRTLFKVKQAHCPECPIGSNNLVIGYRNPGEIIDHMYAKQRVKYSTLWEIYRGNGDCLSYFNPIEHEDYKNTVDKWTSAVRLFAEEIHKNVEKDEHSTAEENDSMMELTNTQRAPLRTKDEPGNLMTT